MISDFAKFIPQKELVCLLTQNYLRSPAIECKEGLCISISVDFELLLELNLEQKTGTLLVKLVLSRRKSGLRTERLSVPVIYFRYRAGSTRTSPLAAALDQVSLCLGSFTQEISIFH
jgi:hypothetical protein